MSKRILVTGGSGQLGQALRAAEWEESIELRTPSHAELDLTDAQVVAAWLDAERPDLIVNAAAYVAVDRAENEMDAAHALNAVAPATLARWCGAHDVPLIQISTDYVFSGAGEGFLGEDDTTGPLNVYGRTKLAGEEAVLAHAPRGVVLRTAWLVSPYAGNFLKTMLRLAAERDEIAVVADQQGCPTSAQDLAAAIVSMAGRMLIDPAHPAGRFHFVNAGEASWFELAGFLFERASALGRPVPVVRPISTADYPTPARRPADTRLATARIARDFGIAPRPWREAVGEVVDRLLEVPA